MFPECKMAASTVYKHRVLDVAILHLGNTHALIGKFCNYVLGRTSFREWIYGDWSVSMGYMEIGLLISSLHVTAFEEFKEYMYSRNTFYRGDAYLYTTFARKQRAVYTRISFHLHY